MEADQHYVNQDPDLAPPSERTLYVKGLLELAKWLEAHPEVPLPEKRFVAYAYGDNDTKEGAAKIMRSMGSCEKRYSDAGIFYLEKEFHGIKVSIMFDRDKVCVRKVVGVETIPAKFVEAHTIPARTVEKVEWDCQPVLKDNNAE